MKKSDYCERINCCKNQLYVIAMAILKNETDAEDAVSNAILKGYEHLGQLKNSHKFKAWMASIVRNEALRMKEKRLELPGNETVEGLLKPVHNNPDELWDVIQTLKEEYRLVVVLFYYNELSLRDISRTLDIPVGTVKSRLNRGRELLRKALEEGEG